MPYAWVRAIVTIALLAQWGGQGHAAGKGHGFDSQKCQKKYFTRIFIPYRNDQGEIFGAYVPVVTTCGSWASGSL